MPDGKIVPSRIISGLAAVFPVWKDFLFMEMRLLLVAMGLLDLNATLMLVALCFGQEIPAKVLIFISCLLLLKAFIAITDPGCITDFFAVALLILSIFFHVPLIFLLIGAGLMGFKGLRSFAV